MTSKREQKAWENTAGQLYIGHCTLELLGASDEPWASEANVLAKDLEDFIRRNVEPKINADPKER